jgi:hypothetical protein
METVNQYNANDVAITAMGQKGAILITDTTAVTGKFRAIQVLENTAFTLLTSDIKKNGATTAAGAADFGTVTAGTVLYGNFTAVTLTSGKVILYK